jgi:hypothetical protein
MRRPRWRFPPAVLGLHAGCRQGPDHRADQVTGPGDPDPLALASDLAHSGQHCEHPDIKWDGRNEPQVRAARALRQPGRGVQRGDHAVVDEQDPVAEPFGLIHVVGDQDDGHPLVTDVLDQLPGVPPGLRVQSGGQLVQDGELRVAHQRQGDQQPLLLPAGQPTEGGVPLGGQTQGLH